MDTEYLFTIANRARFKYNNFSWHTPLNEVYYAGF
jgi:hypothetical protein